MPPISATYQCCLSVPPVRVHQCQLNSATCQCPSVPQCQISVHINATYQCPSELPPSVTHQCLSVLPISATFQCQSVPPISAAFQ
ncbi:unnamed protein product, partial [Staurois parvus]